jgi:hypothetical protein
MDIITREKFDLIPAGDIFASGTVINSPDDIYMTENNIGKKMLWVARKGHNDDWTIYIHWASSGLKYVLEQGDKIYTPEYIRKLVPCTNEIFNRYRK